MVKNINNYYVLSNHVLTFSNSLKDSSLKLLSDLPCAESAVFFRNRYTVNNSIVENDVLFQKVTQAYSEKNPSAPIRSRT